MRTPPPSWIAGAVERAERRSRGEDPFLRPPPPKKRKTRKEREQPSSITIPMDDYKRLLAAAESDDTIRWCERCGAWIDHDDPALLRTDDYEGCVYGGTRLKRDQKDCRAYRTIKGGGL